jgi:hypothetical protein
VRNPVQTNEVARAAALVGGFLYVVERSQLPLRLLELGASAGLNLRWDHFRYVANHRRAWGPPRSSVRFEGVFKGDVPLRGACEVVERSGCDPYPIDPTTRDGELRLKSFVWSDQLDRLERLNAAIAISRRVPATVDAADAADWLDTRLEGVRGVVRPSSFTPSCGSTSDEDVRKESERRSKVREGRHGWPGHWQGSASNLRRKWRNSA